MKNQLKISLGFILAFIACFFTYGSPIFAAYTDYSKYKLEVPGFFGESEANSALTKLKRDTGWYAVYEKTGTRSFEIYSGGFRNLSYAEGVLSNFEETTGIDGKIESVGEEATQYYQVISGGFSSEAYASKVLKDFENTTGIKGSYEPIGSGDLLYKVRTGGFPSESRAKSVASDFERKFGIKATIEPIGDPIITYSLRTGGFKGLNKVQSVIQEIKDKTGLAATYETVPNSTSLRIVLANLNQSELNSVKEYLKSNNWWYSASSNKEYKSYRVISSDLEGKSLAQKGVNYFKENNWWATYFSTGEKSYKSYRVVSNPVKGKTLAEKGLNFFKENNWWAKYTPTEESVYSSYRIVSDPINSKTLLNKGLNFFKGNNWWVTYKSSDEYKIIVKTFTGLDNTSYGAKRLNKLYGWDAKAIKIANGPQVMHSNYDIPLNDMLTLQMKVNPQTDKYRNESRYIHADYVDLVKGEVTSDNVNIRTGPSINSSITQQVDRGTDVWVISKTGDWVEVRMTWQDATATDVMEYLNPDNYSLDSAGYFQFLKLSQPANIDVNEVNNNILVDKGILTGTGEAFKTAANTHNVNELYLISHALLETGNGTSKLATGIEVGKDSKGNLVLVTSQNRGSLNNIKKVYNMYGIAAYDRSAVTSGANYAYNAGWTTPELAIVGGAAFISKGYVSMGQDTLYKMRWNPQSALNNGYASHQYATDIAWAYKQTSKIDSLYQMLNNYTLYFDVAKYK